MAVMHGSASNAQRPAQSREGQLQCLMSGIGSANEENDASDVAAITGIGEEGAHGSGLRRLRSRLRRQENLGMLQLDLGGDAAIDPVVNPLHSAGRFVVLEQAGHFRGATEVLDEGCIVHAPLNTMLMPQVNTACINNLFNRVMTVARDDSVKRLLAYAIEATKASTSPVTDDLSLRQFMDVSSATFTNWKKRGVSKEGAIKAEKLFGCTVAYVMDGKEHSTPRAPPAGKDAGPPVPPANFADRHEVSDSDWSLLTELKDAMSVEPLALKIEEIRKELAAHRKSAQVIADRMYQDRIEQARREGYLGGLGVLDKTKTAPAKRHKKHGS